jgi:hypothetical protein
MSEASERTILLLQELALLKENKHQGRAAECRKRRREISDELKQIAAEKNQEQSG